MAGGTDLLPNLKRRQFPARVLVGLKSIPELHGIREAPGGGLIIGALTTLGEVAGHMAVRAAYPALARAAAQVATPAIRTTATLGGNLLVDTRCQYYNQPEDWRAALGSCLKCSSEAPCRVAPGSERCLAVSVSDTAPALMVLGGRVRLAGPGGEREVPLGELYREDGKHYTTLGPAEILTQIRLPPAEGLSSTYLKLRRRGSFDFPILGVAGALALTSAGIVARAAVVLGAVASGPLVVQEAADLVGHPPTEEGFAAVARAAARRARPLDNADLTVPYRKRMAQVYTARALRTLAWGEG